jgi:hypothetical protein
MLLVDVTTVSPLEGFLVELGFEDGTMKQVDLEPYLAGPMFEPARRDPAFFRSVRVDPEIGTIVWPNGADIDPLVLRYDLRPAHWPEP